MPISFEPPSGRKTSSSLVFAFVIRPWPVFRRQISSRPRMVRSGSKWSMDRGRALEQRGDAAGGDHRHRLAPLGLDAGDQAFDQGDIAPEDARLHGADRVLADDALGASGWRRAAASPPPRAAPACDRLMPGAMTPPSKAPSAATTSKVVAVPLSMTMQVARIDHVGADGVDQAVGAGLARLVDAHLDAEVDVLADHQRLDVQVAARQVAQVEDRLRHHAGDDAGVERRRAAGPAMRQQLATARRRIRRPCGVASVAARHWAIQSVAVMDGEQGVGVALLDRQQHRSGLSEEDVAGGDAPQARRRPAAAAARRRRRALRRCPSSVSLGSRAVQRPPRPWRARGPGVGDRLRSPRVAQRSQPALEGVGQHLAALSAAAAATSGAGARRSAVAGRSTSSRRVGQVHADADAPATGRRPARGPDSTRMPDGLARRRAARRWAI